MSKDDKKNQVKQQKKLLKRIDKLEDRIEALEDELDETGIAFDDETDALVEAFGRVIAAKGEPVEVYQKELEARFGASAQMRDYVGELETLLDEYDPDASDEELDDFEARISCLEHDQRVDELEQAILESIVKTLTPDEEIEDAEAPQAAPEAENETPAEAPKATETPADEDEDEEPVKVHITELEED